MATIEEAISSCDPLLVKRLRGSISAQIECDTYLLNTELMKKDEGLFRLDEISPQLIKVQKGKLLVHFDDIQKIHDR